MKTIHILELPKQTIVKSLLFTLLLILNTSLYSQCDPNVEINVIDTSEVIVPIGTDSCQLIFDVVVSNEGLCDITSFDIVVEVTTPEGTLLDTFNFNGPYAADDTTTISYVRSSMLLYDDVNSICFDTLSVSALAYISNLTSPSSITRTIDCVNALGQMTVCINDESLICDDSNCIPLAMDCEPVIILEVDNSSISLNTDGATSCSIGFNAEVTNNSACDMNSFDAVFTVTTPDGTTSFSSTINGPIGSLNSATASVTGSSLLFYDDVNGTCYDPSQITITTEISTANPPTAVTTSIQCPDQIGFMDVCVNNMDIICDGSACADIPNDCNIAIDFEIDESNIVITPNSSLFCDIEFPVLILNNGGCDLEAGFHVEINITTPEGTDVFSQIVPASIASATQLNFNAIASSDILLDDNTGDCFDLNDVTVSVRRSSIFPPSIVTTIIDCAVGIGYKEVCTNNQDIVCFDTGCDPIPASCDTDIRYRAEPNSFVFSSYNADSCQLDLDVKVFNYGGCDVNGFDFIVRFSTLQGLDSMTLTVPGPFASGSNTIIPLTLISHVFSNPNSANCLIDDDVVISFSIDPSSVVEAITIEVDCISGTGLMQICANDPSIICNDFRCQPLPQTCEVITDFRAIESTFTIVETNTDSCMFSFDYNVYNDGGCSLDAFNCGIIITTPAGDSTVIFTVPSLASDAVFTDNLEINSSIFYNTTTGGCYDISEITITHENITPPQVLTEMVACTFGTGMMEVCVSNNDIICDDGACVPVPETCDVIIDIAPVIDSTSIKQQLDRRCELRMCFLVSNNGGCDITGFDIDFTVSSPEGDEVFVETITIDLPSDTTIMICPTFSSMILFDDSITDCFALSDIDVTAAIGTSEPSIITEEILCPSGIGNLVVCANNNLIICDDTNCQAEGSCETFVQVSVDNSSIVLSEINATECNIDFDYFVTNNGDCSLDDFDIHFTITTPSGTATVTETVTGPIPAGMTLTYSVSHIASVLRDVGGCYDVSDISISFLFASLPEPVMVLVPCPNMPGNMVVCASNNNIVCSDCSVTLALDLFGFNAKQKEDKVELFWSTISEVNNDYFEVEFSENGRNFEALTTIMAEGNSSDRIFYSYDHYEPVQGSNFYRLKMFDLSGSYEYSNVRHVLFDGDDYSINVYPNPSSDFLNISLEEGFELNSKIMIYDITGRLIIEKRPTVFDELDRVDINTLKQGAYLLQYRSDSKIETIRFVKN